MDYDDDQDGEDNGYDPNDRYGSVNLDDQSNDNEEEDDASVDEWYNRVQKRPKGGFSFKLFSFLSLLECLFKLWLEIGKDNKLPIPNHMTI